MKKVLYLLLLALLFQSCYSYKTLDLRKDTLATDRRYKIKMKGEDTMKVDLLSANDSTLTILRYNKEKVIRRSDVQSIESRKFSVLKTVGYPVGSLVVLVGMFAATYT